MGATGLEAGSRTLANRNGDAELAAKGLRLFETVVPARAVGCRGIPWGRAGLGHRGGIGLGIDFTSRGVVHRWCRSVCIGSWSEPARGRCYGLRSRTRIRYRRDGGFRQALRTPIGRLELARRMSFVLTSTSATGCWNNVSAPPRSRPWWGCHPRSRDLVARPVGLLSTEAASLGSSVGWLGSSRLSPDGVDLVHPRCFASSRRGLLIELEA